MSDIMKPKIDIKEAFAAWLTKTQSPKTVNDVFMAIAEADTFLIEHNLSKRSVYALPRKKAVELLTSLRGNKKFKNGAFSSMQMLQRATTLLGTFLAEHERQVTQSLFDSIANGDFFSATANAALVNRMDIPQIGTAVSAMEEPKEPHFSFDGNDLYAALKANRIPYIDNADNDGALWLIGGEEIRPFTDLCTSKGYRFIYKQEGSRASGGKPCWWYKPTEYTSKPAKLKSTDGQLSMAFETLFDGEEYRPLKESLIKAGIVDNDSLKKINLWTFMNSHGLYSIQDRLRISKELGEKLRAASSDSAARNGCVICLDNESYSGTTPSEAFASLMTAVAAKYPLKFRSLCGVNHPDSMRVVLRRHDYDGSKIKLMNPEVYIDRDLTWEQVAVYIEWVFAKCCGKKPDFSITCEDSPATTSIAEKPTKLDVQTEPLSKPTLVQPSHLKPLNTRKAEAALLNAELDGMTYEELQSVLGATMTATREAVDQSECILLMNKRLYHREAFVDFEQAADEIASIVKKILEKNSGVISSKQLAEYVRASEKLSMFLNDNDISDDQQIYEFAQSLFERIKYKGICYVFKNGQYISAPEAAVETFSDIIRKYARERGSTITYDMIQKYVIKLGLSPDNIRGKMGIGKTSDFLIYRENEYLLTESIDIDDEFLARIQFALRKLFADVGDHIILRGISEGWYRLLPELPYGLSWTPMLLQQVIRFWGDQLDARTIQAMDSQDSNTLHAMLVSKDSFVQDFRDAVAIWLYEEAPERKCYEAEELRGMLVKCGMISGNQLIWNMHKALSKDPRFVWSSDNQTVTVRL